MYCSLEIYWAEEQVVHLHQTGYVFADMHFAVCLLVCLSVYKERELGICMGFLYVSWPYARQLLNLVSDTYRDPMIIYFCYQFTYIQFYTLYQPQKQFISEK